MSNVISSVYYSDLDLWKGQRSNLNITNEIPSLTSYLMAVVVLVPTETILKIFCVEMVDDHDLDP